MYPPPPDVEPPAVDPGSLDARCLTGRVLCIDKTDRALRWVVNGRIIMEMDARFGAAATPTREGQFSVFWKDRDHVSSIFESQMPDSMFFSGGQAVHYSADFAAVGYAGASHGCVNIRDRDGLDWLFDQVNVGDKVVVYWS
jgi:lipoprotein-anchoring transpeptidase ErfK/SrfK